MSIPTNAEKRFLAAGVIKSDQDWGTAKAIAAAGGILIDSDGGLSRSQAYHPANESDTTFVKEGDLGPVDPVDFSPEFFMRYDPGGIGILMAQLFGVAGNPNALGNGVYGHTFQWDPENDGEFATFAIERANKIFEVPSAKPMSLDFSVSDGFLRGVIGLRGDTLINSGTENEATEMDALTYADRTNRIKFSQMSFKMNDQSAGAVSGEDVLEVSDFSAHYERPMDGLHGAGSASIIQPKQNGQPIITVTLNFPRMNDTNAAYFANFIAETEKKLRIYASGAIAGTGGSIPFSMQLRFPRMRIIPPVDYAFDEIVPATIQLQAEEAAAKPSGEDYTTPHIYMNNEFSSNDLG